LTPVSILIVEGNPNLSSLLGWRLQQLGYSVAQTSSYQKAKSEFAKQQPSLVILNTELPDGDGLELCSWIHRQKGALIFLISSRTNELDIVAGLRTGADDYLAKPFGIEEFLARVEALTRRIHSTPPPAHLDYGTLKVDLVQRQVRFKGNIIDLTPQEFSLLYVLVQADGMAITRAELLQRAWPDEINNPRTVDTHVLSLRKKMKIYPQQSDLIQTVRNVGYRFNLEALGLANLPNQDKNEHGADSRTSDNHVLQSVKRDFPARQLARN
jgi:two-component system OmpR family response regulator